MMAIQRMALGFYSFLFSACMMQYGVEDNRKEAIFYTAAASLLLNYCLLGQVPNFQLNLELGVMCCFAVNKFGC